MQKLTITFVVLISLSSVLLAQTDSLLSRPPIIELSQGDLENLYQRKRVFKQYDGGEYVREVIVFRVSANEEKIWQTILNYASYPDWVKGVKSTKVYKRDEKNYYVEFVIGHWLLGTFKYSVHHYLSTENSWMKWKMDQSKPSDFNFTNGFWEVRAALNEENAYDVFYSADLEFKPTKSTYTTRKVIKAGLKQTSIWLKREVERSWN